MKRNPKSHIHMNPRKLKTSGLSSDTTSTGSDQELSALTLLVSRGFLCEMTLNCAENWRAVRASHFPRFSWWNVAKLQLFLQRGCSFEQYLSIKHWSGSSGGHWFPIIRARSLFVLYLFYLRTWSCDDACLSGLKVKWFFMRVWHFFSTGKSLNF